MKQDPPKRPELLPCPFCGAAPELIEGNPDGFHVVCECGAQMGHAICDCPYDGAAGSIDTAAEAAELWNRRHSAKLCQRCNSSAAREPHKCPFAEEIHGSEALCNCCVGCTNDCADRI